MARVGDLFAGSVLVTEWRFGEKINKLKVFADFHNADVQGRVRLSCVGTVADLQRHGIVLRDGQSLIIYSEELEFEGIVRYSEEEKLWTAVIDWNTIREVDSIVP